MRRPAPVWSPQIKQREADDDRLTARADQLRDEVTRQRDAALVGYARRPGCGTGGGAPGWPGCAGDGVVVRLADAAVDDGRGDRRRTTEAGPGA